MTTRLFVDGEVTNLRAFPDDEEAWRFWELLRNRYNLRDRYLHRLSLKYKRERMAYLKKRGAR